MGDNKINPGTPENPLEGMGGRESAPLVPPSTDDYVRKGMELTTRAKEKVESPIETTVRQASDKLLENSDYRYTAEEKQAIKDFLPPNTKKEVEIMQWDTGDGKKMKRTVSWNDKGEFVVALHGDPLRTYPQKIG